CTAGWSPVAGALRYARQVRAPAPTAAAKRWHCASAPARPPRLPPKPRPVLVTKNVIARASRAGACPCVASGSVTASSRPKYHGRLMNPRLTQLHPYPFERLRTLLSGIPAPPAPAIRLSIGEPQHATPALI